MATSMMLTNYEENQTAGQLCRQFSLAEIQLATHNFHEDLVVGRGGFGKVYKGFIIGNGATTVAAIKRLDSKSNSGQGATEFWTEVRMLSKFRHCHLVSLIGYCNDSEEMILIYDYMHHGSLHDHLHKFGTPLSWILRLKICIGAARGLDYLHTGASTQHRIIHRDVKSANILLDDKWAAKVADFGLSKTGPTDTACSYVSTNVKGSFGYLDPGYFYTGRLTRKSDVYSFGVLLFEVLCGRRAVDSSLNQEQQSLALWARNCIKRGKLDQIIDLSLRGEILPDCSKQFAEIANQCLNNSSKKRPTMAEVVFRLEVALALQERTDSGIGEGEMSNASGDSDDQEDADDSVVEGKITSVGDGHQDEWILGDVSGRQSCIKPADKVTISGTFDSQQNAEISIVKGEITDFAGDCDNQKNMGSCAEQEVIDADVGSGSGSGSSGGCQDKPILGGTSYGQSNIKQPFRKTFMRKLQKFFFASVETNSGNTKSFNDCSSSGLNHGNKLPQALNSKVNGNSTVSTYEALPSFKDVRNSEKQNWFIGKFNLCSVVFDFTDPTKNWKEKEIKRQTLKELVDYVSSPNGKFTETVMQELVRMVSINIFRRPTYQPYENKGLESFDVEEEKRLMSENKVLENFNVEEEEPLMDPAWPHLQLVYELFLRFVASSETGAELFVRYVDYSFVLRLLDLLDAEDPRERWFLKSVLHRIYGKTMVHRLFIRKAINNIFFHFIFETEKHNGIAELLEIVGSIINGFALPLKEEHKLFLVRVLIPLHKPKCMLMYHQNLSYCIVQFVEKDYKLADPVIRGLLKYWPVTNSQKEVLLLGELKEVLEATQPPEFQHCMVPLFHQISRCLSSSHFQVAERAFFLLNNDHIENLIKQNRKVILPLIFPSLERNLKTHWYQAVQSLTFNVRKIFSDVDPGLFEECLHKFQEDEAREQETKLKREATWKRLEEIADMRAWTIEPVLVPKRVTTHVPSG